MMESSKASTTSSTIISISSNSKSKSMINHHDHVTESNSIKTYVGNKSLFVTPRQLYEVITATDTSIDTSIGTNIIKSEEGEDSMTEDNSSDNNDRNKNMNIDYLLGALSECSAIISTSSINNPKWMKRRKDPCLYFTIRFQHQQINSSNSSNKNNTNITDHLLTKFSSLSLAGSSTTTTTTTATNNNHAHNEKERDTIEQSLLKVAAKLVALQIIKEYSTVNTTTSLKSTNSSGTNTSKTQPNNGGSGSGGRISGLFGVSKKIFTRASTAVTSVLASYDLAEDPNQYAFQSNDLLDQEDEDDAFIHDKDDEEYEDDHHFSDVNDDDDDDANEYLKSNNNTTTTTENGNNQKKHIDDSNALLLHIIETDEIWNINLMADCWSLVMNHMEDKLLEMKDDCMNEYDQLTTVTTDGSNNSTSTTQGIILNRWGDGDLSFLAFCRAAGLAAVATSSSNHSKQLPLHYSKDDVGDILADITIGTSLNVLLMTLIETKMATLCSNGDIVVLFPTSIGHYSAVVDLVVKQEEEDDNQFVVNDVDLAIFKLGITIHSLEERVESLTDQAEVKRKYALSSKRDGDTKRALMYMKRRQVLVNEIDRSSTSILNLESVLNNLKRSRTDIQVLKAYEMANNTMKLIRGETSLADVEDVMDAFHDGNDELQQVQDTFDDVQKYNVQSYDVDYDDLEEELMALGGENDDNDRPSNEEGQHKSEPVVRVVEDDTCDNTCDEIQNDHEKETPSESATPVLS